MNFKKGFNVKYILAKPYRNLEWVRYGAEYITNSNRLKNVILDTFKFYNCNWLKQIIMAADKFRW